MKSSKTRRLAGWVLGLALTSPLAFAQGPQSIPTGEWGLDSLDNLILDGLSTLTGDEGSGAGVTIYVVGTGIRYTHNDFGGRAQHAFGSYPPCYTYSAAACDGPNRSGTYAAGIAAGNTYGVAKGSQLIGVNVLDCNGNGTVSDILAGLNWVYNNLGNPAVVLLTFPICDEPSVITAVEALITDGVTVVMPVDENTCCDCLEDLPSDLIVVGGLQETSYCAAPFAGCASRVDIWAAGENVTSDWNTGDTDTLTDTGNLAAAGYVAGMASSFLSTTGTYSPAEIKCALLDAAVPSPCDGSPVLQWTTTPGATCELPCWRYDLIPDGVIDYTDAYMAYQLHLTRVIVDPTIYNATWDVNSDGINNIWDALAIYNYYFPKNPAGVPCP